MLNPDVVQARNNHIWRVVLTNFKSSTGATSETFIFVITQMDVTTYGLNQTRNLAHTLHRHVFGLKVLPQKCRVNYIFLSIKKLFLRKNIVLTVFYPLTNTFISKLSLS